MSRKITTVIPFVNHQDYIQTAYDSVKVQDYSDWELLFIDNGASDESQKIAQRISQEDSRVKVLVETKKGIAHARNAGINKASGEFICFLDVDDIFFSKKFSSLLSLFESYPEIGMAYGQTERVYLKDGRTIIQDIGIAIQGKNAGVDLATDWASNFYRLPQTGATLVRTSLAKEIGGFPVSMVLGNDDVAWHIELALRAPVGFTLTPVVRYFRHAKSEGARLNEGVLVQQRYLDAHLKYVFPRGEQLVKETGDNRLKKMGEKGILGNAIALLKRNKKIPEMPSGMHFYYKWILKNYKFIPNTVADLLYKSSRRILWVLFPKRFSPHA